MNRPVPLDRRAGLHHPDSGLSQADAASHLQRFGPNDIVEAVANPLWHLVVETLSDPMLWFFGLTSGLYALVGQRAEALTLLAAIVPLLAMDAILHRRTQASTAGLSSRLASVARVIRDGRETPVAARLLVPGDVVEVGAGDTIPADAIVLMGSGLQADESSLTGESFPVAKRPLQTPLDGEEQNIDQEHWGFAGTRLLTGHARLAVVYTGPDTVYGEIVRSARGSGRSHTPLQGAIQRLVSGLLGVALALCGILVIARLQQGKGWLDAFVSAVTLATAAIPEEFPVVFAFYLGVGVYRLAKRRALVRRAVTVENIGRVTCICSDKTGTMTEGRLVLASVDPAEGTTAEDLLVLATLVSHQDGGDPLDEAIHAHAALAGVTTGPVRRLARFPFTEDRKRETTIVRDADGRVTAVSKGAAEVILHSTTLSDGEQRAWLDRVEHHSRGAQKVIACAWQRLAPSQGEDGPEPTSGYTMAGLLGFEDPVREGVAEAAAACAAAGIKTIMVTGDHPATARAVALRVGLGRGDPAVMTGAEIRAAVERDEASSIEAVDVVARATPSEKLTLVRALQRAGHIVAVTGDGVNDVPALQAADIGIAMGERGTRSAREAASIVLLEDTFRTIVDAIAEGRQLFRNLQASFKYVTMTHIPLVVTAALIPLLGYPLLYLPVHIIWLEMLIHPTALLVFQELPAGRLLPQPRTARPRFFTPGEWVTIVGVGLLITGLLAGGYFRSYQGGDVAHGRAMAMAVLSLASATITIVLSRLRTTMSRIVVAGTVGSAVVLIQAPALAALLSLSPLHADDWTLATAANLLVGAILLVADGRATAAPPA